MKIDGITLVVGLCVLACCTHENAADPQEQPSGIIWSDHVVVNDARKVIIHKADSVIIGWAGYINMYTDVDQSEKPDSVGVLDILMMEDKLD